MAIIIPPPPTNAQQGDRVWTDWYVKLQQILSSTAGIAWALVDKTGSALSDLASRNHSELTSIAGTGVNHISNGEAAVVTAVTASGHQGLASINGTGNNHISNAEATVVTAIQTSGHQGLSSINGTGNNHISNAEATVLTDIETDGHQGLTDINGTGDYHITSAEATDVTLLNTTDRLHMQSAAVDPTTANVAASNWIIWKNTGANEVRVWVNDGGTMKKSAAFT
jgi:hypothetical protein